MGGLAIWQAHHPWLRLVLPLSLVAALLVVRTEWFRGLVGWIALQLQFGGTAEARTNPQMASRLYAELLRILEKRGFMRAAAQTPREFAATFALQPALASMVNEFTDLYAQARFGGTPCDASRLRALLDQVRTAPKLR